MRQFLRVPLALLTVALLAIGLACGRSEIKGTYDVEIEIPKAARSLRGILILSSRPLDIPSSSQGAFSGDAHALLGDTTTANSCFILEPGGNGESDPGVVRVLDVRIDPEEVEVPIEILNAPDLRIEITRLEFFGKAMGGELEVHTRSGVRPGRLFGTRTGAASSERCLESLAAFNRYLETLSVDAS